MKKSDLTGAVGSIKSEEIQKRQQVTRIDQAIQGRLSGVQVTSNWWRSRFWNLDKNTWRKFHQCG